MALRSGTGASDYSRRINIAVKHLATGAGLSNAELIKRSGMSLNYFYTRMRGDATFDTNDLDVIARVLGVEVSAIISAADQLDTDGRPRPHKPGGEVSVNGIELARRLRVLLGSSHPVPTAVATVPAERVAMLLSAGEVFSAPLEELQALASEFDVPVEFLTETSASEDAALVEAELELRQALTEAGAEPVAARALGGLSAQAIRAVAASIRSIGK